MRSVLAKAGEAPAPRRRPNGKVLRFNPQRADARGWRLVELVAAARGLNATALMGPDRGKADIALARQLAMYLMHTHYSRIYSEVGRFFGRDRTTVSHACGLIEEMREEVVFDASVAQLEAELSGEAMAEREASHAAR
jgi:chromosomal replication initiation ATPase DnaA